MLLAAALLACASLPNRANDESVAMKELTPTGKLRAGIVYAPAVSVFFAVRDADGRPRGVTVDLADELARQLGVAADFMIAPNSGLVTDAVESGAVDVAFMPVDDERKMRVAFGPNYCLIESTYMVTGASGIRTLAEVDRPNVRVVGIANTTTIRAAGRSLKNTTITAATSVEAASRCSGGARPMRSRCHAIRFPRLWRSCRAPASSTAASSRPASPSP
jgi:polar amino acid transport system substrate-binding protein